MHANETAIQTADGAHQAGIPDDLSGVVSASHRLNRPQVALKGFRKVVEVPG